MAYVEHSPVKPEKLAATAAVVIEGEVDLPNLMLKENFDAYKGSKGDAVNVKVEGVLPWHTYAWRNDRSQPIVFDKYKERQYAVTLGDNIYSAVELTDEQYAMDLDGWGKLVTKQGEAVGRGANQKASAFVADDKNYDIVMGIAKSNLRSGLIKLRQNMGRFHTPGNRKLVVGTDWEAALLEHDMLRQFQTGEGVATSALRDATIGKIYGFDIVVSQTLKPDEAIAMGESAFVFANAAPAVPQSVKFGATGSYRGISTRLVQQYNAEYMVDQSVLNTWIGFRTVKDVLLATDAEDQAFVSEGEYNVRAVKLKLDGTGAYKAESKAELEKVTGVKEADLTVAAAAGTTTP